MQNRLILIDILSILKKSQPTQQQKERCYTKVITIRNKANNAPKDFDILGFNLLHWAVLCNRPEKEIEQLIATDKIDINCGTQLCEGKGITIYNVTPLHLAVQTGNKDLAEKLIKLGADQKTIKRKKYHAIQGVLSVVRSYSSDIEETTAEFALRKGTRAFTLFEKTLVTNYRTNRENDKRDFFSILPDCVASLFHYSKKQKLAAATAYEKLLNETQQEDPTFHNKLKKLKDTHPAVDQGTIGEIYRSSLKARKM